MLDPSHASLPTIALTMGDPAGVGPEVCLRALEHPELSQLCRLALIGDAATLERCRKALDLSPLPNVMSLQEFQLQDRITGHTVIDLNISDLHDVTPGVTNSITGEASYQFIQQSIDLALSRKAKAVVTAPISKEALHAAGRFYPGHTEMFAERCASENSERWCMMQYSAEITCTFVTVHCGYAEVPKLLTQRRILDVLELTHDALTRIRRKKPKIVVCGLNPHAGEHGLFGDGEEERVILPAIHQAKAKGLDVEGPLPSDTAFLASRRRVTDAFVCMYHDQGHIPVKALAFESAVNTTLGITVVRTSVDHGTACDIAWQGLADPSSLFAAVRLAVRLID